MVTIFKPSIVLVAAILCCGASNAAEQRETDLKTAQNFEKFTDLFEKLSGRVSELERYKLRILAEEATAKPELMELAQALAKVISKQQRDDQQETLLVTLGDIACKTLQDGCKLKERFDDHEFRLRELERARQPRPTPYEPVLLPTPIEPQPPQTPPDYVPQPRWDGTLDRITDRPESVGFGATLIARCINYPFADGTVYHGNVYRDWQGRFVLLRHTQNRPISYIALRS